VILKRVKGDKTLLFISNFSKNNIKLKVPENGIFTDFISNSKIEIGKDSMEIGSFKYKILVQ
jgi:hypothetical protein